MNILVGVTGKGWSQLRLNCWSWNLLGTFYRVKLDCSPKEFVRHRFVLAIFAIRSEMAYSRFSAINFISPQRSNAEQNPLVRTFIIPQTIPLLSYSFNRLNCTSKSSIQSPWHLQQNFSKADLRKRDKNRYRFRNRTTCTIEHTTEYFHSFKSTYTNGILPNLNTTL